jgi:DNA repair photolyase
MKENKKTGTLEWMPNSRNRIRGCKNNCRYCYGKAREARYNPGEKADWSEMRLLKGRQSTKKAEGGIMFPTTHDLHIEHVDWWGPFLKEMLENGNEVLIVSKPEYAAIHWICQCLQNYRDQIEFRFTIGTNDDATAKYWEPGAPSPSDRLMCIARARTMEYRVSISMEPLLMEDPKEMIDNLLMGWITGEIWIGCMNHYALNPAIPEEARQIYIQSRENLQRVYESLKDNSQIRWKDSVQNLLHITSKGIPL